VCEEGGGALLFSPASHFFMRPPPRSTLTTALGLTGLVCLCASYPVFLATRGGAPVRGREARGLSPRIGVPLRHARSLACSPPTSPSHFSCSHPGPAPQQQIDPSQPLPRQAAIRGPYTNTGSRDVGLDPRPKLTPPKL